MGEVPRFESVPREERSPLPGHLWWGVVHRDDQTCQWCRLRAAPSALQVDHIIPYSAGGMDNTPNLRTLCAPCNGSRSNFATWEWSRPRPVIATCLVHRRLESIPDYFAQSFELARTLGRPVPDRPADPVDYPTATWLPDLPGMI